MEILSRKDAKAAGSNIYYTGIICKNGHLSYRYTASGVCKDCLMRKNSSNHTVIDMTDEDAEFLKQRKIQRDAEDAEFLRQRKARRDEEDAQTELNLKFVREAKRVALSNQLSDSAQISKNNKALELQAAAESVARVAADAKRKREILSNLVQAKFRILPEDKAGLLAVAHCMAVLRYPELQLVDIDPNLPATDEASGSYLYRLNCHPEDVADLKKYADGTLYSARPFQKPDSMKALAATIARFPELGWVDTTPPINFK